MSFARNLTLELPLQKLISTVPLSVLLEGLGRYPQEEQFKFCPVCGRRLDLYSRDGMTNEQAERLLLSHLMHVAFLMPIEWVEKNGDGSDFQKAYGMALDALRRGGG